MGASKSLIRPTCLFQRCVSLAQKQHPKARMTRHLSDMRPRQESPQPFFFDPTQQSVIAFGSNIGDRLGNIESALQHLRKRGIKILATSSLYESLPMYDTDQAPFLNGAVHVHTDLAALQLLDVLQEIEQELGRVRDPSKPKGPRTLDLDLLYHANLKMETPRLTVPHPRIHERPFVVQPLMDMMRYQPFRQFLSRVESRGVPEKVYKESMQETVRDELRQIWPLAKNLWMDNRIGKRILCAHMMAILNITPDSFSDGGQLADCSTAEGLQLIVDRAKAHIANGATLLDIGGQSTRPGATILSAEEETARVLPALRAIQSIPEISAGKVAVSLDTFWSSVVSACASENLIDIVNDVTGGRNDPEMLPTIARTGKSAILMHSRGTIHTMHAKEHNDYGTDFFTGLADDLLRIKVNARRAGIPEWRVMLDPGIGFSKTTTQNFALLGTGLPRIFRERKYQELPWIVGASRKSFLTQATGPRDASEREWSTAAAVSAAIVAGAHILRVHDSKSMADVIKVAQKIRSSRSEFPFKASRTVAQP